MPAIVWLLKLTVLLAGACVLALLLRRAAAAVRYRLWIGALAVLLIGPAIAPWLRVPVPILAPAVPVATRPGAATGAALAPASGSPVPAGTGDQSTQRTAAVSPLRIAAVAWAVIALAFIARLLWSGAVVRRMVSRGRPPNDRGWITLLYETADRLGMNAVPALVLSSHTRVPLACRLRHPTIVLPVGADEWNEERRRAVLLHELAHVKRRDLLGHTLSRVACAVYWFHPMVWLAAQRLRSESERACDDLALACGAKPSDYAQELMMMVAELRSAPAPATAMAMAANREFEGRIVAILDPDVPRQSRGRLKAAFPVLMIVAFGLALAVAQPEARASTPSLGRAQARAPIAEPSRDTAMLRRLLETDPSTQVRRSVAWSLHDQPEAAVLLTAALRSDRDASVREMAAWALGQQGDSTVLPELYTHLQKETAPAVRATTAWAIGQARGRSATALLIPLLSDGDPNVVRKAVWAIGQNPPPAAPAAVLNHLRHADHAVRLLAAWSLGEMGDPEAVPHLQAALAAEQDATIRLAIFRALFESGDRSPAMVEAALRSDDPEIRERAAQVLAGQKPRPWVWPWPFPDPRPHP